MNKKITLLMGCLLAVVICGCCFGDAFASIIGGGQESAVRSQSHVTGVMAGVMACPVYTTYTFPGDSYYMDYSIHFVTWTQSEDYACEMGLYARTHVSGVYDLKLYVNIKDDGAWQGAQMYNLGVSYFWQTINMAFGRDGDTWRFYRQVGDNWNEIYNYDFGFEWEGAEVIGGLEAGNDIYCYTPYYPTALVGAVASTYYQYDGWDWNANTWGYIDIGSDIPDVTTHIYSYNAWWVYEDV